MLGVLLLKDLRRAARNPWPYLIQLAVPLLITALLGMVFAGAGSGGEGTAPGSGLARIRLAVVDEDDSTLTRLLRGALNQGEAARRFEAVVLDRDEALRQVTRNALSAALIIPRGFTRAFLLGEETARWELVKNPAQSLYPAVVEELLAVATAAMNALSRNLRPDLDAWREVLLGGREVPLREVGELLIRTGERVDALRRRLDPLPVWVAEEVREPGVSGTAGRAGAPLNLFAFLLPGLASMFLLFLGDVAMRDLGREVRIRTFARYGTLPTGTWVFVLSKVLFTLVVLALSAAILLGGGAMIFGFRWERPVPLAVLALGMALFSGGLMAMLGAAGGTERRAEVLNTVVGMLLGLASGGAFPAQSLPAFLREQVTPLLPPAWFIEAARGLQLGDGGGDWAVSALRLAVAGLVLAAGAAAWLHRTLDRGGRS